MAPTTGEILLRLSLAFLAGLTVGWERETRGRAAGLRTLILVCTASAVAAILSEILLVKVASSPLAQAIRADPVRLGAGILTGIGFLGAGTVVRHENVVRGITTAASIWFMAVTGLALGAGQLLLGLFATVLALAALMLLTWLENHVPSDRYAMLTVTSGINALSEDALRQRLQALDIHLVKVRLVLDLEKRQKTLQCEVRLLKSQIVPCRQKLVTELSASPDVIRIEWE